MNHEAGNLREEFHDQHALETAAPEGGGATPVISKSFRAKVVYVIWRMIPRLFLIGLVVAIVLLFGGINEKKAAMEKAKADAKPPEAPLINTVVMPLVSGTMKDRINLPGSLEPWTTSGVDGGGGGRC